ncbi:MAG: MEDS domain-containing protein [Methanomassiliicoccales archaeon]
MWIDHYGKGDHVIQVFTNDAERLKAICDLIDWVKENELVVYICETPLSCNGSPYDRKMEKAIREGRVRVISANSFYFSQGKIDHRRIMEKLDWIIESIHREGNRVGAAVGDLSWALGLRETFQELMRYEAMLHLDSPPMDIGILCQYDSRILTEEQKRMISRMHAMQLRNGQLERNHWLLCRTTSQAGVPDQRLEHHLDPDVRESERPYLSVD